jgi:hypothetical protein
MARTHDDDRLTRAASASDATGPGLLFNLRLTIAWLHIQLLSLLRLRAS